MNRNSKLRAAKLPVGRRVCSLRFSGEEGNALVETAIVLPLFLAVVLGIGWFGYVFWEYQTLTYATGVGARQAQQLLDSGSTDPCLDTFNAIKGAAAGLNSSNIGLTLTMNGNSPITGTTCSGKQTQLASQASVTVTTTYPYILPLYGFSSANQTLSVTVTELEY